MKIAFSPNGMFSMINRQLDEETIFHTARKIADTDGRQEYLDQICAGDQALRQRVEALLATHEQQSEFLRSKPPLAPTLDQPSFPEAAGQQIGRYKLLQQIGEGGLAWSLWRNRLDRYGVRSRLS
jgi:hypothetical protein